MTQEIYKRLRPTLFKHVVGQKAVVSQLEAFLKTNTVPHALAFFGPSGTGKTTLARIMATKMGCQGTDLVELDCAAVEDPTDTVRSIVKRMGGHTLAGHKCRIWIFNEIQAWSKAGFAQQAMLTMLEDTPSHVYFFLCATDPDKIIKAIKTRCTSVWTKSIGEATLKDLLTYICKSEKYNVSPKQISQIAEMSNGSARTALVMLDQIVGVKDDKDRQEIILSEDVKGQAFDIVKKLLWEKTTWKEMAELLSKCNTEDPEQMRYLILANATNELLKEKGKHDLAAAIIAQFQYNFYDTKRAGLVWCCYEILRKRK